MCLAWMTMSSSISLPSLTRGQKQAPCGQALGLYAVHCLHPFPHVTAQALYVITLTYSAT